MFFFLLVGEMTDFFLGGSIEGGSFTNVPQFNRFMSPSILRGSLFLGDLLLCYELEDSFILDFLVRITNIEGSFSSEPLSRFLSL